MRTLEKDFLDSPKEYVVLNSSPEEIILEVGGETRMIPAAKVIVKPHPLYTDVPYSAADEDGDPIPGSLIFRDIYAKTATGERTLIWDAVNSIKLKLGYDPKNGTYTGAYGKRGLSVLPSAPTKEDIKEVRAEGFERWKKHHLAQCVMIVDTFDSRNEKRKLSGLQAMPPDPEYIRALTMLREERADAISLIRDDFGLRPVGIPTEPVSTNKEEDLSPEEIVDAISGDRKVMAVLRKRYNIRKKRAKKVE